MSYKVEELLALRDSVSESAVSLEKFADEEVIKEHVLRPSASATLAAASSNKSLRASATPAVTSAAPAKKPSPSPSIKRGKAERLLKEHGSPPGIRVTAGGRIVPIDPPPVLNNRFVNTAFKPPALRSIQVPSTMSAHPRSDAGNAPRLEVVGNQPVLYVGDRAYALPALDTTNPAAPALTSGAVDTATKSAGPISGLSARGSFTGGPLGPPRATTPAPLPAPFSGLDITTLKAEQTLKKQELRTLEQTEVLQASHQTDAWRAGVIEKKRNLIIELDALRKQITAIEDAENNNAPSLQPNGFTNPVGPTPASMPPSFVPPFQQPMPAPMYGFPAAPPYSPMMMYQQPFGGFPTMPAADPAPFVQNPVPAPHSPGSASRRSHAIQIKPPPEENKKQITSALDPKSPTYEPVAKTTSAPKDAVPPTPSPDKQSPWRTNGVSRVDKSGDRTISQKPSLSSIDTADFFPTNPHEHSSTRNAPQVSESKTVTNDTSVVPSTPEKNWPASPWNDGGSSRSSRKAAAKLTSWPEAFGKPPSSGSLRQKGATQPSAAVQDRVPPPSTEALKSALSSISSARKTTDRRLDTEETWPLVGSKPISHTPSTYQEGFQAGYDHVGVPDSPDVLKGYIQGLLQFLHDESKKGRNNSLRGLVAGSQPHDSAVSMTFNRMDAPLGSQENLRSAKINALAEARRDSVYGTADPPLTYTLCNEASQEQRMQNIALNTYRSPAGTSDRVSLAYQQTTSPAAENDSGRKGSEKGTMSRSEAASMGYPYRQFSGNQLGNRTYATPVTFQRQTQAAKEQNAKDFRGDPPSFVRPFANQRLSGLDGAMDDLAEMVSDTHVKEQVYQEPQPPIPPPAAEGVRSTGALRSSTDVEEGASCFRPSSSNWRQKVSSSPVKSTLEEPSDAGASSPVNTPGSPKKSSEHSPAKAKLEQVTNKFRRKKKDSRNLSPDQKKERARKWRERFGQLREEEGKSIDSYKHGHASNGERR